LKEPNGHDVAGDFAQALRRGETPHYQLSLYVTGSTPKSAQAILAITQVCEQYLSGHYDLEVVDIYQQPERARLEQIIAAPTLVKKVPLPLRRLIGNLSNLERVLGGLDLAPPMGAGPT